ncbi:SH3 domain-containing protein [Ensifer sp. 4252]|uniref:SH3 domain-containing protein n=1 Tax=Ensifer sp. 4252 TaxID=3373915 RepID=UPI003D2483EB
MTSLIAQMSCALLSWLASETCEVDRKSLAAPVASAGRVGRVTGLAIPRFVSLKSSAARLRIGPSTDYPIIWLYVTPGLPLEVVEETGNWRMVRDADGAIGWMSAALLSGQRMATVGNWLGSNTALRTAPATAAPERASLQSGVLLKLVHCDGTWCEVTVRRHGLSGYVRQVDLWGAYRNEVVS